MTPQLRRGARRWIAAAAGVLLLGGWWVVEAMQRDAAAETVAVVRDDLVLSVEVNGTLSAVESIMIGAPTLPRYWNYKISHMAPEGEPVSAGTPVLSFDTTELQRRLLRRQADADEAVKQIDKTAKDLELQRRQDELRIAEAAARRRKAQLVVDRPGDLSSAQELAAARLDLRLADRELEYLSSRLDASRRSAEAALAALADQRDRAQSEVDEVRKAIEQMARLAPRDGTVIYATDWNDAKKSVGDSCWRGETVMELPDLGRMRADGEVDEENAGKVRSGHAVSLRLDAHPDLRFSGRVASIGRSVGRRTWSNPLKVARLEIELAETDTLRMRPGMRFRGEVETERVDDALLVPVEAVFPRERGPVVYREGWLGVEPVTVELGRRNQRWVEVLDGLAEGDRLATREPVSAGR